MRPSVLHGLEVQSECGFECDFPRIVRSGVLHGLEIQRECGFECDYIRIVPVSATKRIARIGMRILLANARSTPLAYYARNNHKKKDPRVAFERSVR